MILFILGITFTTKNALMNPSRPGRAAGEGAETVTFLPLVKKGRNRLYHSISYHIHPYALEFAAFHKGIITT